MVQRKVERRRAYVGVVVTKQTFVFPTKAARDSFLRATKETFKGQTGLDYCLGRGTVYASKVDNAKPKTRRKTYERTN